MGVGFITGRNGCNKTDKILDLCFEEAKKESTKPIYILVPEKYTYEMEKKLSDRFLVDKDPFFRIRVVSFSTLSKIVFTNVGGIKDRKIGKSARTMLIYKALDLASKDLKTFKSGGDGIGLVNKIMDIIIEFKQNDMSVDDIFEMAENTDDEALKHKLNDLAKIYSKYENLIDKKYIDTEDSLSLFADKLVDFQDIKGATIFVDEYTGFTPVQYLVIEKLIISAENIYFSLTTDLRNFNSGRGVFSKTNITFLKINEICQKNGVERLKDENMSLCSYFDGDDLIYLEKNINEFNPKPYEKEVENIEIFEFNNTHLEIEYIAGEITRLVRDKGYRYNEITIGMRNLDSYSYLIKGIFENYDIGYFLDEKIAAKNNPIIVLILSILDMKLNNYSYNSMFRYLKSGLTGIDNEDIYRLENYVLANGIRGKRWFDNVWDFPVSHSLDEEDEVFEKEYIENINKIRRLVMKPIENLHKKLAGRNRVSEICRYLYDFTVEINLSARIDDIINRFENEDNLYKAKEYSQVWNIFISMLDELVEFLGDEKIGIEKFIRLMEAELEGFELGIIPPSRDQVFVTTVDRMKNPNTKIIFLLGVNDGVFPQTISDNSMLTDLEKEKLLSQGVKFDSDSITKAYDEQFLVYKAFSTSKSKLVVSYSVADFEGKAMRPSPLIKKLIKIFPKLKVNVILDEGEEYTFEDLKEKVSSKEKLFEDLLINIKKINSGEIDEKSSEIWREVYRFFKKDREYEEKIRLVGEALKYCNYSGKLDKFIAGELYGNGNFSISKIEKFAACPFSYFLTYGLNAKEREEYKFTPMDSGSYAHKILDEFSKRMILNGVSWNDIDDRYIESEVNRISGEILETKISYILNSSEKYKYLTNRVNKRLIDSIGIMSEQVRRSDFNPEGFEVGFGFKGSLPPIKYKLSDGRDINLRGKIDRLDVFDDGINKYLMVIDYKSSTRDINLDRVYHGLDLQLFIYMNAMLRYKMDKNLKPAALLYSRFNPKLVGFDDVEQASNSNSEEHKKKILEENKLNGLIIKDIDLHNHLDNTIGKVSLKSSILPLEIKKDYSSFSKVSTRGLFEDEFDVINEYVIEKSKEICENIYSGNIDIHPYRFSGSTPCEYCEFNAICQFDRYLNGNNYNNIYKKVHRNDYEEIIKLMKEKLGERSGR